LKRTPALDLVADRLRFGDEGGEHVAFVDGYTSRAGFDDRGVLWGWLMRALFLCHLHLILPRRVNVSNV
jgi:hypothetical protein